MRARKPVRAKKTTSAKYFSRTTRSARAISTRTMFAAVLAVLGAAIVIGAATSNVSREWAAPHTTVSPAPAPATSPAPARAQSADAAIPAIAPAAEPAAVTSTRTGPVTTLTGCLAREDTAYKLKDTSGDAAPKSRSWKTGFLRKASTSVELYDSSNHAKLPAHVGQRVSITGELIDREMYVRSLQRVAASCASKS
jgi:hypothetical protein